MWEKEESKVERWKQRKSPSKLGSFYFDETTNENQL